MAKFKVLEYKSDGIEEIVNPIAPYARELRERALVLDTETSGSAAEDEVVELGVVRASNGEVVYDGQFKPSKKVEYFAYRVHGISDAELASKPRIVEKWHELYPILDGMTCVAWNAPYDSRLLVQTVRKYGLPEPQIEWVCLMALYRKFRGLSKNCKLEHACDALGVRRGNHRGAPDALAAARVLYRIAQSAPEDEVITYARADVDEADEMTITASAFLREFDWSERKRAVRQVGMDEFIVSEWMDPATGRIYPFLEAMEICRERMMRGGPRGQD